MLPPPFSQVVLETQACWLERAVGPPLVPGPLSSPPPTVTLPSLARLLAGAQAKWGQGCYAGQGGVKQHSAPWSAFSPWEDGWGQGGRGFHMKDMT